jgi:hypothetical protein
MSMCEKEAFTQQDGNRDWVSIIETISADGQYLLSYIIFKAVNQQSSWFKQLDTVNAKIAISRKE